MNKHKQNKRVLFISEFFPDDKNSVAEILSHLLNMQALQQTEKTVCLYANVRGVAMADGVKTVSNRGMRLRSIVGSNIISSRGKLLLILDWLAAKAAKCLRMEKKYRERVRYFKFLQVVKEEKPDLIFFLLYTPDEAFLNICKKTAVPFVQVLYDTVITSPEIDPDAMKQVEQRAMEESCGYFVPKFFYEDYLRHYPCNAFCAYHLPLLIGKDDVVKAFQNRKDTYQYTYFGQIQPFRNQVQVMKRMRELGMALDVFTTKQTHGDDLFRVHSAVSGEALWRIVAESRFLIAFDNSVPYAHYLPSKAYLYVSFTKPIIAFGDNEDSALIRFFKDYPYFYYQNINEPADGLLEFICRTFPDRFDEALYDRYLAYSPERALEPIEALIGTFFADR